MVKPIYWHDEKAESFQPFYVGVSLLFYFSAYWPSNNGQEGNHPLASSHWSRLSSHGPLTMDEWEGNHPLIFRYHDLIGLNGRQIVNSGIFDHTTTEMHEVGFIMVAKMK